MTIRGIRGATTVETDTKENILSATRELLKVIFESNPDLEPEDIASAIFTTTEDIVSAFPAAAARQMSWNIVPMVCAREIPVPNSLEKCIRVLIHWNTNKGQDAIQHVYLHSAKKLRPDLDTHYKSKETGGKSA